MGSQEAYRRIEKYTLNKELPLTRQFLRKIGNTAFTHIRNNIRIGISLISILILKIIK